MCDLDHHCLAGGFNPFEKYESNWIISPGRGEKIFETTTQLSDMSLGTSLEKKKHPRRGLGIHLVTHHRQSSKGCLEGGDTPWLGRERLGDILHEKSNRTLPTDP